MPRPIEDLLYAMQGQTAQAIFIAPDFQLSLLSLESWTRCTDRNLLVLGYLGTFNDAPIIMHRGIKSEEGFKIVKPMQPETIDPDFWDRNWG